MSTSQAMKKQIDQLRQEANTERIKVSQASADLIDYCQQHAPTDGLLVGVAAKDNPFNEKKSCVVL